MHTTYVTRQLEKQLMTASNQFPAIIITGARQSGKSTLLTHCFPDHRYVTLDDLRIRNTAVEDPELFLENYPPPCIIDEIQYAPKLLSYIKIQIDKNRDKYGQFLLTGSQIFPLTKGLTESLAGRAAVFQLPNFNLEEFPENIESVSQLFNRIFGGSYPDPLLRKTDRNMFYSSYIQTYIERDIRQIENIQDILMFQSFLELIAARTGSIINKSEIARSLGISQPTINRWISILAVSGIIFLLRPFSKNITKRIVKAPKVYFWDTGLASYLLNYPDAKTLAAGPMNGHILETFVISEILKKIHNMNLRIQPYFYRDSNQNEIDLVLDCGSIEKICEIKLAKTIQPKHHSQLEKTADLFSDPELSLISGFPEEIQLTRKVRHIPAWKAGSII